MKITVVSRVHPDSPAQAMLRLQDVRLNGVSHAERSLGVSLGFSNGPVDAFASFLTEQPVVVPVNSRGGVEGLGWYVPYGIDEHFDASSVRHPVEQGWQPADPTAAPYVRIAMRQHCDDCASPALRTVPWVEVGGQRFSDLVSVSTRPSNDLARLNDGTVVATNGSGHLVSHCEWVADLELIGAVEIEQLV